MKLVTVGALVFLSLLTASSRSYACASCGSGGDDPLILYPWESWKVYAGFSHTSDFVPIDINGQAGAEFAPEIRDTTTVSFGHSVSNRAFATVTAPYIVNKRGSNDRSSWGDPMVTTRYTLVQQDMSDERIPQVQLIAAMKAGNATSVYDYNDPAQLDVVGSGVPEGRVGVDIWHGMFDWKAGFAQTITSPLYDRQTEFGRVRNSVALRSTATLGYGWGDRGKVLAGINREQAFKKFIDGVPQANSQKLNHSVFMTADAKIDRQSMIRLTVSKSAAFGINQNTSRNESVTLAMMRSF